MCVGPGVCVGVCVYTLTVLLLLDSGSSLSKAEQAVRDIALSPADRSPQSALPEDMEPCSLCVQPRTLRTGSCYLMGSAWSARTTPLEASAETSRAPNPVSSGPDCGAVHSPQEAGSEEGG